MGEEYEEMVSPGASLSAAERTATKSSAATSGFTLDTSGRVEMPEPFERHGRGFWYWSDLDAFTQGYVEAALEEFARSEFGSTPVTLRFDSLAPETLSAILKDCAARSDGRTPAQLNASEGRYFWENRQAGSAPNFPPLTATLGDDGKVYLREATGEQP